MVRKFYRLSGLSNIFKSTNNVFDTNIVGKGGFTDSFIGTYCDTGKIDEHTILFITATAVDEGKYVRLASISKGSTLANTVTTFMTYKVDAGDTMIWARGQVYCVSKKSVVNITFNNITYKLTVYYSDGTSEDLQLPSGGGGGATYLAGQNITISTSNVISAIGYLFDDNKNFIENNENNAAISSIAYAHVEGACNVASASFQHVGGKFSEPDQNKAYILGWGTDDSHRSNIFTISFTGVVYTPTDVTAAGVSDEEPDYRLQDIHSVFDVDWVLVGLDDKSFDEIDFDESYK